LKKLLILSLGLLCLAALAPQTAAAAVGIKGGLALSNLSFSAAAAAPPVTNIQTPMGGIFFGLGIGPFSIQPEILYVRMGGHMAQGADWMEYRDDYVQVPLLFKINIIPGPVSPMFYGGPYGAYLFSAKGVSYISGVSSTTDIKDQLKTTDYGVAFGGGIDFRLPVIKLSAEVRYNLGLANLAKNPAAGYWVKNRSLMALVGLGF
jgi:hypothetical protein